MLSNVLLGFILNSIMHSLEDIIVQLFVLFIFVLLFYLKIYVIFIYSKPDFYWRIKSSPKQTKLKAFARESWKTILKQLLFVVKNLLMGELRFLP